ncbi:MAG: IS110 family transposase [Gammaproteobacteria bacterium]|nr:IS110 family transposase [Gammaproteobacteria bacterium]
MNHCKVIGIDTAKHSFALHGADASGGTVFNKTLTRAKVLPFLSTQAPCTVALECCGGSHYWGHAIRALGHDVKLIPANYVKPFVKRQKNDANDAVAVAEAASRASMRFVAVKTRETQARAALYRTRALFVQQRTQTANAIRSHLLEFGIICGRGFAALGKLRAALEDGTLKTLEPLPVSVPGTLAVLFDQVERLTTQIDDCEAKMRAIIATDPDAKRYQTVPGVGPITAFALLAFAGDLTQFKNGREFAAWIGLTPREYSTGGQQRLGGITKMGQRDLRYLLVQGGMALVRQRRRKFSEQTAAIQDALVTKPKKVLAVAWANKNARVLWALTHHGTTFDHARHASSKFIHQN